jgi:hypothetical protein
LVFIESVDGQRLNSIELKDWVPICSEPRVGEIRVLPGEHTIGVSYRGGKGGDLEISTQEALLAFVAEPGRTYAVHAARVKGDGWKELRYELLGGRGIWTAWVTDAASGQLVAGQKPER